MFSQPMIFCFLALLALTRAEIIERMRAPVITQAEGFVQVFADCPDDMRREFQSPIARFAADTVHTLRDSISPRPEIYRRKGLVIYVGDVRTNLTTVTARAVTNDTRVFTRIYVHSPGYADLQKFRLEVVKAFFRNVYNEELGDIAANAAWRRANPDMRIYDERKALEEWYTTGYGSYEDGFRLMRKIVKPGFASRRDVLIFASRLYLYPPEFDLKFANLRRCLSFKEAIEFRKDPLVRLVAFSRANFLPVFGGGRGDHLYSAAKAYRIFLLELSKGEKTADELKVILDEAEALLHLAYEKSDSL